MKCLSHSALTLCFQPFWLSANPALMRDTIQKDKWALKTRFYSSVLNMPWFQVHPCSLPHFWLGCPIFKKPHSFFAIPSDLISIHGLALLSLPYVLCPLTCNTHPQIDTYGIIPPIEESWMIWHHSQRCCCSGLSLQILSVSLHTSCGAAFMYFCEIDQVILFPLWIP